MPAKSQETLTTEYQVLLSGLPMYFPNGVLVIDGQTYTTPQLQALIVAILAAMKDVALKKGALVQARMTAQQMAATTGVTIEAARQSIALQLKSSVAALAGLGISLRKPPTRLTVEARLAKAEKAKATRVARGTKGRKARLKITGNVTGVTITPVMSPEAETPAKPSSE